MHEDVGIILYILVGPLLGYILYAYLPPYVRIGSLELLPRLIVVICCIYIIKTIWCLINAKSDGWIWKRFQYMRFWKIIARGYFDGKVYLEEPLNHQQLYIFCSFPHGAATLGHVLTMTNTCEMLSKHYTGERRDLAASILFYIPMMREVRVV